MMSLEDITLRTMILLTAITAVRCKPIKPKLDRWDFTMISTNIAGTGFIFDKAFLPSHSNRFLMASRDGTEYDHSFDTPGHHLSNKADKRKVPHLPSSRSCRRF